MFSYSSPTANYLKDLLPIMLKIIFMQYLSLQAEMSKNNSNLILSMDKWFVSVLDHCYWNTHDDIAEINTETPVSLFMHNKNLL